MKGIISPDVCAGLDDELWYPTWCECYPSDKWIACDSVFDKTLVEACYQEDIITKEQIPTIDWDAANDQIILAFWMVNNYGILKSFEDLKKKFYKKMNEQLKQFAKKVNVDIRKRPLSRIKKKKKKESRKKQLKEKL